MKIKIIKKLAVLLLSVSLIIAPCNIYAGSIEGANTDEKAMNAGYDLYETITILVDGYVGDAITVEQLYEAALRGIAEELDEYSLFMSEEEYQEFENGISGNYEGLGIVMTNANLDYTYVKEVFEDSPAEKAGVRSGDIIIEVNGTDTTKMNSSEISEMILSSAAKTVKLKLMRGEETLTFSINKSAVHMKTVSLSKIEDMIDGVLPENANKIRYVALTSFGDKTYEEFKDVMSQLSKDNIEYIILDLRDNTGGYLSAVENIAKLIVPDGTIYQMRTGDGQTFTASSKLKKFPFEHIVVLTNHNTASASELLAAALQDSKAATLIGQKTYGKGVVQDLMPTANGGVFKFTSAEYLRRNNGKVNKLGVSPNILIDKPNYIEDYATGEADAGTIISDVKKLMAYIGYSVDGTSVYNDKIKKEIMSFQKKQGINPSGIPDLDTVVALNTALYQKNLEKDVELEAAYEYIIENYLK